MTWTKEQHAAWLESSRWRVHAAPPVQRRSERDEDRWRQVVIVPGGPPIAIDAPTEARAQELARLVVDAVNVHVGHKDAWIADILEIRLGVEPGDECPACGGWGRRAYASTATWRGGVGGQSITGDVCDGCWGSGSRSRPGADLRRVTSMHRALRNVLGLALKRLHDGRFRDGDADHLIRYCAAGGVEPSILRAGDGEVDP